jgi:hypothetical protein
VHGRTILVQPRTIRPHHGSSGTLRRTVWICHGPFGTLCRTVRICCGSSAILCRTVRIWHKPTSVLHRTIRLYTSPRIDRPSRAIYDRIVRVQPWTIRPDHKPSSPLRRTVRVRDYPGSTIYGWIVRTHLRTVWPGCGPSVPLRRTVRVCVRGTKSCTTIPTLIAATIWYPPATHYNHAMPPHGHRAEYCSATREPERYRAGAGDINRTSNTHLGHPWEESRQSDVRQPEISTHKLNGWSPDMAERIRDEVAGMFRDKLGVSMSSTGQSYRKPYSHRFDIVSYPQGTRIPDFSKFSGEGGKSTHEHISQFIAHLGELANGEAYRVRLFSLPLTDTAFTGYAALPPNSINSWEELERKFHEHFFSGEHELELDDLASV